MELHKLEEVHPMNRGNMRAAYFAYLQNTPGSKKAMKECLKEVLGEKEDEEKSSKDKNETSSTPKEEAEDSDKKSVQEEGEAKEGDEEPEA